MPQTQTGGSRSRHRAPRASGLVRHRLLDALAPLATSALALVVGPPGSGKTTLMAQYAHRFAGHVVWYRAEPAASRPTDVLDCLAHGLTGEPPPAGATTPESVLAETERFRSEVLLVVDDLHALGGAGTETILERLVLLGPPNLHVLIGSRRLPHFNLSRLELGTAPLVDEDLLRFRWWEVDRLFGEVYEEPLHPEDVLPLTRLTEGWAAGLHLLHLGTRGRPLAERRRALALEGSRFVRGYLEREILDPLPAELREFLTCSSVLDVLTAGRCDELLGRTGSRAALEELTVRQALRRAAGDGRSFRCAPLLALVLRGHLVEQAGAEAVRAAHRRAAAVLEKRGAHTQALAAGARAGDWATVARMLGAHGARIRTREFGTCLDALPPDAPPEVTGHPARIRETAHRKLVNGQLDEAAEIYRALLETLDPGSDDRLRRRCGAELALARTWRPEEPKRHEHWSSWLRAAAWGRPSAMANDPMVPAGAQGHLVRGLAALLAGDYRDAYPALRRCRIEAEDEGLLALAAEAGLGLLAAVTDGNLSLQVQALAHAAEQHDHPWIARLARALLSLGNRREDAHQARLMAAECDRLGDGWGAALAMLVECIRQIRAGQPDLTALEDLERRFRTLGAGTAQAWAQALRALAEAAAGLPDAAAEASRAETFARSVVVPGAQAVAYCALAVAIPASREEFTTLARATADFCGMSWMTLQILVSALGAGEILGASVVCVRPHADPGGTAAGSATGSAAGSAGGSAERSPALSMAGSAVAALAQPSAGAPTSPRHSPGGPLSARSGDAGGGSHPPGPRRLASPRIPAPYDPDADASPAEPPAGSFADAPAKDPANGERTVTGHTRRTPVAEPPVVAVRCFGSFEFTLAGRTLNWSAVRPRARALLRLLALHGGRAVHREDLLEALWPDLTAAAGTRNLQVAVSSLRTFLEPGLPRGTSRLVVRDGEAYLLTVPADGFSDVVAFNDASRAGRRARASGRLEAATESLRAALAQYTGDLLPEDGPAEWVVAERERYRREAAEVAGALAEVELGRGNALLATEAALRSLDIDPFRDSSWRTLIAGYEQAGDAAAAKRAQRGYADMLASLGVSAVRRPQPGSGPGRPAQQRLNR